MSGAELKQRLAAILAADVADYSRLMATDERGTVAALDAARSVFRLHIATNQGRVIDMAGDSVLALFETAIGAVSAALAVQRNLTASSGAVPEDRRMRFRIGIHLGDVIEKGDGTIYGDGVNIAARLESLAEPDGVTVSDAIQGAVRGKVAASFADQGEQTVKNIAYPVRTFRVVPQAQALPAQAPLRPEKRPGANPSIAVLAFDNMSGDPAQEYFCDGISEDIITDLSKINGLAVIGRQSSFAYKGKANDLRRIGRELGVRYVLEGSVRKAGNRVRVNAQLIEAETGTHVWADRYDRELENVFLVGDEIAEAIVTSLDVKLGRGEDARIWNKALKSADARDAFNRGWAIYRLSTEQDNRKARDLFHEVMRLEPDSATGYAYAATTHVIDVIQGWSNDPAKSLEQAKRLSVKAIELDDTSAGGHFAHGVVALFEGSHQAALAEGERALEMRPMCSAPKAGLAYIQLYSGILDRAMDNAREAIELNPIFPAWYLYLMSASQYFGGRHEDALSTLAQVLAASPRLGFARLLRIAVLSALRRQDEARAESARFLADQPGFSLARFALTQPFRDSVQRDCYFGALRAAGLPE